MLNLPSIAPRRRRPSLLALAVMALAALPGAAQEMSLTTTYQANNGSNGNMFDVVSADDVIVTRMDVNLDANPYDLSIYYTPGGYAGKESDLSLWTLLGVVPGRLRWQRTGERRRSCPGARGVGPLFSGSVIDFQRERCDSSATRSSKFPGATRSCWVVLTMSMSSSPMIRSRAVTRASVHPRIVSRSRISEADMVRR